MAADGVTLALGLVNAAFALVFMTALGLFNVVLGTRERLPLLRRDPDLEDKPWLNRMILTLAREARKRDRGVESYFLRIFGSAYESMRQDIQDINPFSLPSLLYKSGKDGSESDVVEFYTRKILYSIAGIAIVSGSVIAFGIDLLGPLALLVIPLAWWLGYSTPDRQLRSNLKKRDEQILFELPQVIARLLANIRVQNSVLSALETVVHTSHTHGFVLRELNTVMAEVKRYNRIPTALMRMAARNVENDDLRSLAKMLLAAEEKGPGFAYGVLQDMQEDALKRLQTRIIERGQQNTSLMIVPNIFALMLCMIVMLGPTVIAIFRAF